jgi:ribosomal protein S18 acetylase RimI-like enzyme
MLEGDGRSPGTQAEVEMATYDGMVHLRRAREADARAIADVHVRTWQQAYRDILPAGYLQALSIEARERYWATELRVLPAERRPWLAEAGPDVVGFVSAGPSRDEGMAPSTAEIYALYVMPECWDRGVGRSLLLHCERELIQHGYEDATLWLLADNDRARAFYEAHGWQPDGAVKQDRIGDREVAELRYRRTLERSRVA